MAPNRYPSTAKLVREMSSDGRELVRNWQSTITVGLQGFIDNFPIEASSLGMSHEEVQAGLYALRSWHNVMLEVQQTIANPDWCCKRGMLAYPTDCPVHGQST